LLAVQNVRLSPGFVSDTFRAKEHFNQEAVNIATPKRESCASEKIQGGN